MLDHQAPCSIPRREGGRGRGRVGRNRWPRFPRRPAGPPCGQPTRPLSFSDLRGTLPRPAWFAPAHLPSLGHMHQSLLKRVAEAWRRAFMKKKAYRQAMELHSDEGIVLPVRTPSPDRDLQLLWSLAATEALESLRSPSPSVVSGSVVFGQKDSTSVSYSARTLSPTAWSARAGVSLGARRNSHQ